MDALGLIFKIARANGMFVLLSGDLQKLDDPEITRLALMPYMRFGTLRPPMISLN